jgi:histidyl-tRNA synthetase
MIAAGLEASTAERVLDFARLTTVDQLRADHGEDAAVAAELDRMARYLAHVDALGIRDWVVLDLTIVRGLAYYTGIVFELFDARGEFRAICGGGRYDTLLGALGGVDLPALGFGMGDVVLGELLKARGLMPAAEPQVDYWIAVEDMELLPVAQSTASLMRRLGHSVEYPLREQALGKQLKAAVSAGARTAAILRRSALAERGEVVLRSLSDGAEESRQLGAWLEELISAAGGLATDGAPPPDAR